MIRFFLRQIVSRSDLRKGGERLLGLSVGVEGLSPSTMHFGDIDVRLVRVPVDLSLHGVLSRARLDGFADLGLALTWFRVDGVDLAMVRSASRLEPGLRIGSGMRVWLIPRLALAFGVEAWVAFQASPIAVDSLGVVGTTARAWIGTTAGLAVRLH